MDIKKFQSRRDTLNTILFYNESCEIDRLQRTKILHIRLCIFDKFFRMNLSLKLTI